MALASRINEHIARQFGPLSKGILGGAHRHNWQSLACSMSGNDLAQAR